MATLPPSAENYIDPGLRPGSKIRSSLEILGLILGPAILLEQVGHLLVPYLHLEWLPSALFLAGLGLMVLLVWKGKLRFLFPYVPWLICAVLSSLLAFRVSQDKRPALVIWSYEIVSRAKRCEGNDEDKSKCVFKLFSSYKDESEGLSSELDAGSVLMSSDAVRTAMNMRFGIKSEFLGTGSSLPDSFGKDYSYAHIPEYLIPNRQDKDDEIWTWRVDPKLPKLVLPLEDILRDDPDQWKKREMAFHPVNVPKNKKVTPLQVLQTKYSRQLALNDSTPIVIRFAQFPEANYRGTLGHPDRHWVFASHLGELLANRFTLQEALSESGYSFDPSKNEQTIFVWVFIPSKTDEVVRATWHSVLLLAAKER